MMRKTRATSKEKCKINPEKPSAKKEPGRSCKENGERKEKKGGNIPHFFALDDKGSCFTIEWQERKISEENTKE